MLGSVSTRALLAGVAFTMGGSAFAASATLPISDSITAPAIAYMPVVSGSGTTIDATGGGTYNYGNSLGALANTLYTSGGIDFNFYDDYKFTVTGSTANSVTSTINIAGIFAIDNLQARLFSASGNTAPVLGAPAGCPGASCSLVTPWGATNSAAGGVSYTVLNDAMLNPGTYVLQLRGSVSGSQGGSYAGVLNVAPVPVPSALWLITSAVAGLGTIGRKRRY